MHDCPASAPVHYCVQPSDLHAHLYTVTLTIARPLPGQQVSLPVWIPGSYLVREFAKNLQNLHACQSGHAVALTQLDKHRWALDCATDAPVVLTYAICAYDTSVRTAWLDQRRGFFNGTSVLLRVHGQEAGVHHLRVDAPAAMPHWRLALALPAAGDGAVDARGFGCYHARDYDELVDSPVEMGPFWQADFQACGVAHRLVVAGAAPGFDAQRLLRDTQRICEAVIRFWHPTGDVHSQGPGHGQRSPYIFMLHATHDGYGGLEHRNSTALICARADLPGLGAPGDIHAMGTGYMTLLGLICHEYFHTWNVKRLRPAEFARYDYDRENYTRLLWFFEGFTSYYDDLLLRRAGLLNDAAYLHLLAKSVNQVRQTPGRHVQSVAQASFDAWVKYYRNDENTPNATVSYYSKGALLALCLDLQLRRQGQGTLDDVMRALWQRCVVRADASAPEVPSGAMTEADLLHVLRSLTGQDWAETIHAWAHTTQELPVQSSLQMAGVRVLEEVPAPAAAWSQRLGLRVNDGTPGLSIRHVLHGGAAQCAGMMPGDEWLAVEIPKQPDDESAPTARGSEGSPCGIWRLHRLEELSLYLGQARRIVAWVARDRQVLRLTLHVPEEVNECDASLRLSVSDPTLLRPWLDGASV